MWWEWLILILVVGGAAFWVVRRIVRRLRGRPCADCAARTLCDVAVLTTDEDGDARPERRT